jgi:hypothetical protein
VADNDDVDMSLLLTAWQKRQSRSHRNTGAHCDDVEGVVLMEEKGCWHSPHVGGIGESGLKCFVLVLRKEDKSRACAVSDEALNDRRKVFGDLLHRMIARIKVCADEFQKEEEEKIFCGGASLM